MRCLIENQLPRQVARWFGENGHEAEPVRDRGRDTHSVIVIKDEDFADYVRRARMGPAVLRNKAGNGTTNDLLRFLAAVLEQAVERLKTGERLVEIR